MEAFKDFLHHIIGICTIPLADVIHMMADVPVEAPPVVVNQLHSKEHVSVENELIAHASHAHVLFKEDNSMTYYHFEEAMHGMTYAASIKLFQRSKDRQGAWFALTTQYARKDKCEA